MNKAASIKLAEASLPHPAPVSSTHPTASGPVATVTQGASRRARQLLVPGRIPAASGPSNWPELVLEGVISKLDIGDLMACSQVCRHWRQVATGPRVQISCLRRTYTAGHRLQMERALDTRLVRASLMLLYDKPATASEQEPAILANQVPSPEELLCRMLHRMLLTERFHPGISSKSPLLTGAMQDLLCSPDGRMIASVQQVVGTPKSTINLWEDAAELITVRPGEEAANGKVSQLAFSSDGAKLRVLFRNAVVKVWQRNHAGGWSTEPGTRLFEPLMYKSVLSCDGQRLAVMLMDSVRIYGEGAQGGWEPEPELGEIWQLDYGVLAEQDPDQILMQFSGDGRHFVFGIERDLGIWTRLEGDWRHMGVVRIPDSFVRQAVFDSHSRLLALAYCCDSDQGSSVLAELVFYRLQEVSESEVHWKLVTEFGRRQFVSLSSRAHPQTGCKVPVAFSPDGELMACPHYENCRIVLVLPVSGPDAWWKGSPLTSEQEKKDQASYEAVSSLQFSANSRYLAVGADRVVILWARYPSWQAQLRISDAARHTGVPFVFSPDGFHCVCVTSELPDGPDRVSIWGPVGGGGYGCKLRFRISQDTRVGKVLFTADATRLVIAVSCRELVQQHGSEHKDFRIGSRLFYCHLSPSGIARPEPELVDAGPVVPD